MNTENLSKKDGALLLKLARQSILSRFNKEDDVLDSFKTQVSAKVLKENRGTFVSLHKKGQLRGCIGNIEPVKTIFKGVMGNAKHAAFNDSRFTPMSYEELKDTIIEVSILTRPEKIKYTDSRDLISKIKPKVDGVIINKDNHGATFLPQVWKQLKSSELFLSHLCMKAGLSSDEWKACTLNVFTYQVQLFEEQPKKDKNNL